MKQLFANSTLPVKLSVLNKSEVDLFRETIDLEILNLYQDYNYKEFSFDDFRSRMFWHESLGMKILATRVLLKLTPKWIKSRLDNAIKSIDKTTTY